MVDLHLFLFVSIFLFFCRCCLSKLNMSRICKTFPEALSAINPFRYHGLKNHGATCYLNSVLQVLFMTEDFREAVNSSSKSEFIDHHLKDLFKNLLTQTSDSSSIIQALGIERVYEQQDAAEYCQKILRMTSPDAAKIFHGQMTERTTCLSCQKQYDTDVPFWLLPLSLVNSGSDNSVDGNIEKFFRISSFSGENQIYCEKCDKKSDATSVSVVKHHPDVLILLLKRFIFCYNYMTYIKVNLPVEVPFSMKIPENQTYELYAVIDHFGDLRSGHYSSRIRSQPDSGWYQFNDNSVTALGCCKLSKNGDTEKSKSAYLLFYRKKDIENSLTSNGGFSSAISEDPGAEKRAHSADKEKLLPPGVSLKAQNSAKNEPVGLDEIEISDNYMTEPKLNDYVCKEDGLRRTDVEKEKREKVQAENLQQHSDQSEGEGFRNVNRAEHPSIRLNEERDAAKPADFDGEVNDKRMKTDMLEEGDEGVSGYRTTETRNPGVQDRQFAEGDQRCERSTSGVLSLDPLQEEEGRAQEDEDPKVRPSQATTFFMSKPVEILNKRKLPDDLTNPDQKKKIRNKKNPSVNLENGKHPGLQQSGKAENQTDERLEKSELEGFQAGSGFQEVADGRPSPKQMNVLVLEEEEQVISIVGKKIIVKVIEETLYNSIKTYHGHNQ
ncbi:ubiquitin carboxyl-terminal hydrolase 48 isoform X1 [Oryzias latipes]|uniref:Ubiquitin carboxyl-terminal hydrolase n=1 Tax=Oryzias latipes TaxID=8090 RepID=A0A3B3I9V8_ORYLA|nr:ubiquitin carboxyl-terminal hydrolase 48 isoform X1 [Oryzias latipes]